MLIRGGGSQTDLAVFDSRAVAEAVATAPFPVLTGLGHEIDQSIADLVAHTALKTPTRAAEHLVERVARADQRLRSPPATSDARPWSACAGGGRPWAAPSAASSWRAPGWPPPPAGWPSSPGRLPAPGGCAWPVPRRRDRDCATPAARWPPGWWRGAAGAPDELARRLVAVARGRLREAGLTVDGLERLTGELAPERTLERGFSITRNAAGRRCGRRPRRRRRPDHHATGRRDPDQPGRRGDEMSESPRTSQRESPEDLKFGDAMEELEAILRRIEGEEIDIDSLAEELGGRPRCSRLCRGKIRKAEVEVTQIVQGLERRTRKRSRFPVNPRPPTTRPNVTQSSRSRS